jgi:ABC-type sugar transport system permease subunit
MLFQNATYVCILRIIGVLLSIAIVMLMCQGGPAYCSDNVTSFTCL